MESSIYSEFHHWITYTRSFPNIESPSFGIEKIVTDGSYILFGTGNEQGLADLAIFDIAKAEITIIPATKLLEYDWPDQSALSKGCIKNVAFHSGLLIFTDIKSHICFCYKLHKSTLTRIYAPEFPLESYNIKNITINMEFICIETSNDPDRQNELLLFDRNFVLQGKTKSEFDIKQLTIQGKYIIALTEANIIEFWHIKEKEIEYFKHTPTKVVDIYSDLGHITQSKNHDSIIIYTPLAYYLGDKQTAIVDLLTNKQLKCDESGGCLDVLSSQYFATFTKIKEIKEEDEIFRFDFEISDINLQNKKRISFRAPSALEELRYCTMHFSTIIMIFTNGILRCRITEHKDIYQNIALSSCCDSPFTDYLHPN